MRVSDPEDKQYNAEHKSNVGAGGYRLDASRNMWEGSGLKIDSANTDVAWCHGNYNAKILTSARNGTASSPYQSPVDCHETCEV